MKGTIPSQLKEEGRARWRGLLAWVWRGQVSWDAQMLDRLGTMKDGAHMRDVSVWWRRRPCLSGACV